MSTLNRTSGLIVDSSATRPDVDSGHSPLNTTGTRAGA
jgi:hypothetical protein